MSNIITVQLIPYLEQQVYIPALHKVYPPYVAGMYVYVPIVIDETLPPDTTLALCYLNVPDYSNIYDMITYTPLGTVTMYVADIQVTAVVGYKYVNRPVSDIDTLC
jgi:predicted secreted protein